MINKSGLAPLKYRCVVLTDVVPDKIGSIFVPESKKDRDELAQVKGTLIAHGDKAFEDFGEVRPVPGDRVLIIKYGGRMIKGADGQQYRVVNDDDIIAIIDDDTAVVMEDVA